jgi:hypothetical protein
MANNAVSKQAKDEAIPSAAEPLSLAVGVGL